jgi:hypothetical protein
MERVMTAVVIHRAPLAMRRILLDSGPPILKTLTVTNEARALDIFLFAARPAELDVGENLVEFLLNRQDEIKWSTLIYFKREWSSKDSMIPRIGTQGRDFEHKTHIHIEWAARDRDFDDFKDAMAQQLEVVFGPNPYDE